MLTISVFIALTCATSFASSGNGVVQLQWVPRTEVLNYRSCGAADTCWVAQLTRRKNKKTIATIRCDGEKFFSSIGDGPETLAADNCAIFEKDDKFQEIRNTLNLILKR